MTATITDAGQVATQHSELAAFIAELDVNFFTGEAFTEGFIFWIALVHGRITVVAPEGYDPAQLLTLVRESVTKNGWAA